MTYGAPCRVCGKADSISLEPGSLNVLGYCQDHIPKTNYESNEDLYEKEIEDLEKQIAIARELIPYVDCVTTDAIRKKKKDWLKANKEKETK